jgi:hypothetical protein
MSQRCPPDLCAPQLLTVHETGATSDNCLTQVSMFIQPNVRDALRGRILAVYLLC